MPDQDPSDDRSFIHGLFAEEVPQVASGLVEIKAAARMPGVRTKVAVASRDRKIDPVGTCVGWKNKHINRIVARLNGERVDLLPWSATPERFVRLALAPAWVALVTLDVNGHRAIAYVRPDQFEYAVGKDGANRELASRLTGWIVEVVATDAPLKSDPTLRPEFSVAARMVRANMMLVLGPILGLALVRLWGPVRQLSALVVAVAGQVVWFGGYMIWQRVRIAKLLASPGARGFAVLVNPYPRTVRRVMWLAVLVLIATVVAGVFMGLQLLIGHLVRAGE
jgi:transcription antitermination factor NusA-like protein